MNRVRRALAHLEPADPRDLVGCSLVNGSALA
jgi:hypothetical protein